MDREALVGVDGLIFDDTSLFRNEWMSGRSLRQEQVDT